MSESSISRKDFLKGAAVGAVGLGAASVLDRAPQHPRPRRRPETRHRQNPGKRARPITKFDKTVETDVLVVGAGNAGLFAACAAAEKGARVVVLERNAMLGTGREWIGGLGSRLQKSHGVKIDRNEIVEEVCRYASHRTDQRLVRLWADKSGETIDWLETVCEEYGAGLVLETDTGAPMHGVYRTYPIQHNIQDDKRAIESTEISRKKPKSSAVTILLETPMAAFLPRNRASAGRRGRGLRQGREHPFLAKKGVTWLPGVTPTTWTCWGGKPYGRAKLLGHGHPRRQQGRRHQGGHVDRRFLGRRPHRHVFDRGGFPVGEPPSGGGLTKGLFLHMGSKPFLKVNRKGERFCNESVPTIS